MVISLHPPPATKALLSIEGLWSYTMDKPHQRWNKSAAVLPSDFRPF